MKLRFLGHSAFEIVTESGITILIDPFIDHNPVAPIKAKDIGADYIILSHAHGDHLGDTIQMASDNTTVICVTELAGYLSAKGCKTHGMQVGGSFKFDFGTVKLTMALHGSQTPDGHYAGLAAGIILKVDGKTLYHAGDTGLFGDMKLIGELHEIDYFMVPIGGNYTMDVPDAVLATKWINPALVIPMHYNSFPIIETDPKIFFESVSNLGIKCLILAPGEVI